MVHRYFASTLGAIIVALLVWALLNRRARGQPLAAVAVLLLLVCVQGLLGMKTVTLLLQPLIVTAHLLGGLTTLALLWWLSLEPRSRAAHSSGAELAQICTRWRLAALALQIALGGWTSSNYAAIACPDLPTCQRSWWPDMDFRNAFVLWRGLGVDYEGGVLAEPGARRHPFHAPTGRGRRGQRIDRHGLLTVARSAWRPLRLLGGLLVIAVLLQIAIGVAMVHFHVPLALATLHNAGAALLVIVMVTLLRALWPRAWNAPPPAPPRGRRSPPAAW